MPKFHSVFELATRCIKQGHFSRMERPEGGAGDAELAGSLAAVTLSAGTPFSGCTGCVDLTGT